MIRVQPSAYFLLAEWILLLPLDWLIAALLAAAVHELGHLAAISVFGIRPEFISIGDAGARICTKPLDGRTEFFCAAAGPAASLLLLSLCRFFPKLAICGMVQGMFNLIPVHPMDGGRMLSCALRRLCPRRAEGILHVVQNLILCIILALSVMMAMDRKTGLFPIFVCIMVLTRVAISKIPCKSGRSAVQ